MYEMGEAKIRSNEVDLKITYKKFLKEMKLVSFMKIKNKHEYYFFKICTSTHMKNKLGEKKEKKFK